MESESKPTKRHDVGFWHKRDFLIRYGVTMPRFEKQIEPIMEQVGWVRKEKQTFSKAKRDIIINYLEGNA